MTSSFFCIILLAVSYFLCTFAAMKRVLLTLVMTMAMIFVASGESLDSLVMERMFTFQRNYTQDVNGFSTNVYTKHIYQTHRRNLTLWAIPDMYKMADGERLLVSEQYGRFTFRTVGDYTNKQQVYNTTIRRNRHLMPVLVKFMTPDLYGTTLYEDHMLSPFCRENKMYYHYSTVPLSNHQMRLYFRPRIVPNTQLVTGRATVDCITGRIDQAEMEGEFDMIHFQTLTMQGEDGLRALLPKYSITDIVFKFAGNNISSHFEAVFDCPVTLPDTVDVEDDRALMDSVRPISLTEEEISIFEDWARNHGLLTEAEDSIEEEEEVDTLSISATLVGKKKVDEEGEEEEHKESHNYLKEIGWDLIGENLFNSHTLRTKHARFDMSSIIDPQYISYSRSKGLAYKMKFYACYDFDDNTWITLRPQIGYNFKLNEIYYSIPLRFIYDPKKDAGIDATYGKDNRIGNSSVLDEIKEEHGDIEGLDDQDLDLFDDYYMSLYYHIKPKNWWSVRSGVMVHQRRAINPEAMEQYGKFSKYYSVAPSVTLRLNPWENAPYLTINYERGIKLKNNYINYERWEADASYKYRMRRTEQINVRVGAGLYTAKSNNYFLDFANFRANNLPDGWDDDWSGDFQLLSSRLYNESSYYIRGHLSYEAPLLGAFLTPYAGRLVERERIYLSTLSIDHTRQYSELGYGFSCRFVSIGVFASFLNTQYQDMGVKFTFELFRRW